MKYYTDEETKRQIDVLLEKNAKRQANLGTDSTEEEQFRAVKLWKADLNEIAKLDPDFASILEPQE